VNSKTFVCLRNLVCLPILAVAMFAVLPTGVEAQDEAENVPAEYRQSLMQGLRHHQAALRTLLDGGVDYSGHIAHHAHAIEGIVTMAADAFPEGSGGDGSRAMAEIWDNPSAFMEKLAAVGSAASGLSQAADAGSMDAVRETFGALGQGCRGCHMEFRARAND